MYARLDDELIDHAKVFHAGTLIGTNGPAIALGMYTVGLLWSNKHLSDGVLPSEVVRSFPHVSRPVVIADALCSAGLWEKNGHGWKIHDYAAFGNPSAAKVKAKRRRDKARKRLERGQKGRVAHGRK